MKRLQKEADDFLKIPNIYNGGPPAYGNMFFEFEIIKKPGVRDPVQFLNFAEKKRKTTQHIPHVLSVRMINKLLDIKQPGAFVVKPRERGDKHPPADAWWYDLPIGYKTEESFLSAFPPK